MRQTTIELVIDRFDPEGDEAPHPERHVVPYGEDMVVLDALSNLKRDVDGSLTYRASCRMGICGSCGMMVNGTPRLACGTYLREFYPAPVHVAPLANFPVIRDLVIDISDFLVKLSEVQPWLIRDDPNESPASPFLQTPAEHELYKQYSMCINCMLCYSACPVYALEPDFHGPAALALGRRYNLDSRDQGKSQRLLEMASSSGIWDCTFIGECSAVCPKGVDPAKAIQQTKWETTVEGVAALVWPWGRRAS